MSQNEFYSKLFESSDDDKASETVNKYTGRCDFENFKKWPAIATQLLINLRLSLDDKFSSGYVLKKTLWKKVSKILIENGFDFGSADCEAKFKGMKLTYKRNVKKIKENPDAEILWPYFRLLHEYYGEREYKFEDETDESVSNQGFDDGSEIEDENNRNTREETTGIFIKWPYTAVELLIDSRLSMEQKFKCHGSQKLLWNKISTELNKNGFLYSGDACASKFKRLLVTYKRNLRNRYESDKEIVWPYFEKLHKVFSNDLKTLIMLNNKINKTDETFVDITRSNDVPLDEIVFVSDEDETKTWNSAAIQLLINKRGEMHNEFMSGHCPKKDLWFEISNFLKNHEIEADAEGCREKFKGLILTYRRNLKKYIENNKKSITWPFFKLMHQKFGINKWEDKNKQEILDNKWSQETSNDSFAVDESIEMSNDIKIQFPNTESDDYTTKTQWDFDTISKLLKIRLKMKEKFAANEVSENLLWKNVSQKMKQMGFQFSYEDCHLKFKSIYEIYKMFKTQNDLFENRDTWPFFHLVEQIFPNETFEVNFNNKIDFTCESQFVKDKVKSHILTEMFHSSSSDCESYSISENEDKVIHTEKRSKKKLKFEKLMHKRLRLEEERNDLLKRKIEAAEKKNLIFAELVDVLKQNRNLL